MSISSLCKSYQHWIRVDGVAPKEAVFVEAKTEDGESFRLYLVNMMETIDGRGAHYLSYEFVYKSEIPSRICNENL